MRRNRLAAISDLYRYTEPMVSECTIRQTCTVNEQLNVLCGTKDSRKLVNHLGSNETNPVHLIHG